MVQLHGQAGGMLRTYASLSPVSDVIPATHRWTADLLQLQDLGSLAVLMTGEAKST